MRDALRTLSAIEFNLLFSLVYLLGLIAVRYACLGLCRWWLRRRPEFRLHPVHWADDPAGPPAAYRPEDRHEGSPTLVACPDAPGESEPLQGWPEGQGLRRAAAGSIIGALVCFGWIAVPGLLIAPGMVVLASLPIGAGLHLANLAAALGLLGARDIVHPHAIELGSLSGRHVPLRDLTVICSRPPTSVFQWVVIDCGAHGVHRIFLHAESLNRLLRRMASVRARGVIIYED